MSKIAVVKFQPNFVVRNTDGEALKQTCARARRVRSIHYTETLKEGVSA
jgi:hypothetical protein